jgi:hypothetical protein
MLCADMDWANVGQIYSKCLQTQGIDAEMFVQGHTLNKDPSEQGTIMPLKEMIKIMDNYDVIQFMHSGRRILVPYHGKDSGPTRFDKEPYLNAQVADKINNIRAKGAKTAIFHGGTFYRLFHKKIHKLNINSFFDTTFIQTGDLFNLGGHNEKWLLPAIDVKKISPCYKKVGSILKIAHYPSNASVKNTAVICSIVNKMHNSLSSFEFDCNTNKVPHVENLKRMSMADVYIEHQKFKLRGCTYGEFGVTALEAAAVGSIVVTCTKLKDRYKKEYGEFMPYISNSEKDLKRIIKRINNLTEKEIIQKQKKTRQWVCDNHSYEQMGKRLLQAYDDIS